MLDIKSQHLPFVYGKTGFFYCNCTSFSAISLRMLMSA